MVRAKTPPVGTSWSQAATYQQFFGQADMEAATSAMFSTAIIRARRALGITPI
jgi:hypothetical protein